MQSDKEVSNEADGQYGTNQLRITDHEELSVEELRSNLETVLSELADDLRADVVTSYLYDNVTNEFYLPIGHGLYDPDTFMDPGMRPRIDRVAGRIVRRQHPIIAAQVRGHRLMDGPFARREGIVSAAGFPLVHNHKSVGLLFVSFRETYDFPLADQQTIQSAARKASKLISDANVFSVLRRLRLRPRSPEEQTLWALVSLARNIIKFPVAIWVLEPDGQTLSIKASTGLTKGYVVSASAHIDGDDVISEVIRSGASLEVYDLQEESRFHYHEQAVKAGWSSMLVYPVDFREQTSAVLQIFTYNRREFGQQDYDTLERVAEIASVALENAYRSREAEELADVAQRLSTAPGFEQAMPIIVESARKLTGADSSVIIFLDSKTDRFVVACRRPEEGPPTFTPRQKGGLTRHIIDTGQAVKIDNTMEDLRVSRQVVEDGIRSMVGVRLQLGQERIGALYIDGTREAQFKDYDLTLLQALANQFSVALCWARWLREPSIAIERATSNLFRLETILDELCREIQSALGFEYAAVQLIRPEDRIIETVHGTGVAEGWTGRARHYLEDDPQLRDIQTDITMTGHTEIISGEDSRFDRWIFDAYHHKGLVRVFTPLVLIRDRHDNLIHDWYDQCQWKVVSEETEGGKQHVVVRMQLPERFDITNHGGFIDIIGTVEAGFRTSHRKHIQVKDAIALARLVGRRVMVVHQSLLRNVFETVVRYARTMVHADSASLHFLYEPSSKSYVYEVCDGDITRSFLRERRPRPDGLGQQAIRAERPKFVPDPSQGHGEFELRELNPGVFDTGIRSIAAFPLLVGPMVGILYVHFKAPHRFTEDEINWVQLFAQQALDGIRHATTYTKMRDHARQLTTLHSVAQSMENAPGTEDLLRHIAWNTLNLLAADVVTIYEYVEAEAKFVTPPQIAGRLLAENKMVTEVGPEDAPIALVKWGQNVFADDSVNHPILENPDRERPPGKREPFVKRERIKSSAGILLDVGGEVVGTMFINYRRHHQFSEAETKIIETLAAEAAVAVKNRRFLETLLYVDRELITTIDLRKLLDSIVQRAVQITGADRGDIRRLDPVTRELVMRAKHPLDAPFDPEYSRIPLGAGITGWVAAHRESLLVNEVAQDDRYLAYSPDTLSELAVPLLDANRQILGVLNVESAVQGAFDRMDQRRLEGLANQAVLAIQNAENQEQRVALETMATVGDLAGSLIHRMNNDVGLIRKRAKFIKRSKRLDQRSRDILKEIELMAERVIEEAQELKRWIPEEPYPVDVQSAALRALLRVSSFPGITVTAHFPQDLGCMLGGEQQLVDVFTNLIQNAVNAMKDGDCLSLGAENREMDGHSYVLAWVRDTGRGIPEKDIDVIFQRGYSERSTDEGLGFGLWWTRTYVERLGGRIAVDSRVGEGSTFRVLLPRCESPA
jgi:GAF domain-containing protein